MEDQDLLTAEEARKISNSQSLLSYEAIISDVRIHAYNGYYEICYDKHKINSFMIEKFEGLGYTVTPISNFIYISWK